MTRFKLIGLVLFRRITGIPLTTEVMTGYCIDIASKMVIGMPSEMEDNMKISKEFNI